MKKFITLFKYELKTIVRDPINLYMFVFPVIILILSAFVFPLIFESIDPAQAATLKITMLLLVVIILAFGTFFLAAMATFLLLEHKDECTLNTIAVTPVGASGYIQFKMGYIYIMSVVNVIIVLLGTKWIAGDQYVIGEVSLFDNLNFFHILLFAIISGLFAPGLALFQAAFAKNKVEGFAFIKGTGIIALLPALMILEGFQGGLQYLLGIFPNFWAIKGIMIQLLPNNNSTNLPFSLYLLIGFVYNLMFVFVSYRFFLKKTRY